MKNKNRPTSYIIMFWNEDGSAKVEKQYAAKFTRVGIAKQEGSIL